jgi:hypothetical protein
MVIDETIHYVLIHKAAIHYVIINDASFHKHIHRLQRFRGDHLKGA